MANTPSGGGSGGRKTPTSTTGRNRKPGSAPSATRHEVVSRRRTPRPSGPGDVYICGECVELCQSIIDQGKAPPPSVTRTVASNIPSPRTVK